MTCMAFTGYLALMLLFLLAAIGGGGLLALILMKWADRS